MSKLTEQNPPSEITSLLQTRGSFDSLDAPDGLFQGESIDVTEMKRTTHNDPALANVISDMRKLRGSTSMLMNLMAEESHSRSMSSARRSQMKSPVSHETKRQSMTAKIYRHQRDSAMLFLQKVTGNFFDDARSLAAGTIPQSIVLALTIGTVCGVACWLYYTVLFSCLGFIWKTLPEWLVEGRWQEENYWLWMPLVTMTLATCVGLAVVFLGEPGDLPYTISRVHHHAFIPMDHVWPMVVASLFSILAGGSLGPEAPLVAICGALGGFVSRSIFRQKYVNVVRKHTLMGMAGALAAFFGAPLGGSLFALEVCSRFGVEYFEHLIESIFCGEVCLVVFRSLSGLPIKPIWDLTVVGGRMEEAEPWMVAVGGCIGVIGAGIGYIFALFHWTNMEIFASLNLLDNSRAVYRAWLGGIFIVLMGIFLPQTMFW
jgi:H+/Cl- antiporter ClcA